MTEQKTVQRTPSIWSSRFVLGGITGFGVGVFGIRHGILAGLIILVTAVMWYETGKAKP